MNKLPNFLITGAAKCGTSSLHYYLNQHPEIFMPSYTKDGKKVKEPMFLGIEELKTHLYKRGVWTLEEYKSLFEGITESRVGEATVFYLPFYQTVIPRIKAVLGDDIKIIIMLRNPIDRAYSAYQHTYRNNPHESLSFENALELEEQRYADYNDITPMTLYKRLSLYSEAVEAYQSNFKDVRIIFYEDFKNNTLKVVQDSYTFLNVDNSFVVDTTQKVNVGVWNWTNEGMKNFYLSKNPVKKIAKRILSIFPAVKAKLKYYMMSRNTQKVETMQPETRKMLQDYFREDIDKLSKILNKNLSHWK